MMQNSGLFSRFRKSTDAERQENLATFVLHQKKAAMYYAYNSIYRYTVSIFFFAFAEELATILECRRSFCFVDCMS